MRLEATRSGRFSIAFPPFGFGKGGLALLARIANALFSPRQITAPQKAKCNYNQRILSERLQSLR